MANKAKKLVDRGAGRVVGWIPDCKIQRKRAWVRKERQGWERCRIGVERDNVSLVRL